MNKHLNEEKPLAATAALRKTVQTLEASQTELEKRLKEEIERRKTLETSYEKLSEFRMQQSSLIDQITKSRDAFRMESIKLKKTIEAERNKHAETVEATKLAASSMARPMKDEIEALEM